VTKVTDANGTVLYEAPGERDRVIPEEVAKQVNYTLSQVIESGTGTDAKIGMPAAGKTGTTDDYRDAWFAGYTCHLTAAVWMGYPGVETRYMDGVTGGSYPAEIWRKFMERAMEGYSPCPPYEKPDDIESPNDTFVPGGGDTGGTTVPPTTSPPSTDTTTAPTTTPPTTPPPTTVPPTTDTTTAPTTTIEEAVRGPR
jgi:penicillin-binding protein 1A